MPIVTRKSSLALPEIGSIRKGAAKEQKTRADGSKYSSLGRDLGEKFRVIFFPGNDATMTEFIQQYGSLTPKRMVVTLPFDEINASWDNWFEAYTAGRLVARCDGSKYEYQVDPATGERLVVNGLDANGKEKPWAEGMEVGRDYKDRPIFAKEVGRLRVVIPSLGRYAILTVMTTSRWDCAHITAQLNGLKFNNDGRIAGIPLVMTRRVYDITVNIPGSATTRQPKWLISLEPDPEWVRKMLSFRNRLAEPGATNLQLSSGEKIEPHDQANGEPAPEADQEPGDEPGEPEPEGVHYVDLETGELKDPPATRILKEDPRASDPVLDPAIAQAMDDAEKGQQTTKAGTGATQAHLDVSIDPVASRNTLQARIAALANELKIYQKMPTLTEEQSGWLWGALLNLVESEELRERVLLAVTGYNNMPAAQGRSADLVKSLYYYLKVVRDSGGGLKTVSKEGNARVLDLAKALGD